MPLSPADIRNTILLSVVALAAGLLVPLFPYLGMPLAAFALAWITYRFGVPAASALALVASVPMAVVGPPLLDTVPLDAAYVAVTLLAVGPLAAWGVRRYSAYTVAAAIAVLSAAAFLIAPIGYDTLASSLTLWREIFAAALKSASVADPAAMKTQLDAMIEQMRLGWPYNAVYTMGIGALLSVRVTTAVARSADVTVNRYPQLADTDLSFHLVWPTIAGLGLLAAGLAWGGGKGLFYEIGFNVLMVVRPALVLQGLALFSSLYRRMNAGRLWTVVGFTLLIMTEFAIPSLSILGAVDLFANLRKLPRRSDPARM